MTIRQDITAAIDETEQQLLNIADQVRAHANTPLPASDWTVRDMLCHIAATSSYAALFGRVRERGGTFPTPDEMNEINHGQLAARTDKNVDDLFAEATRGYADARVLTEALSDEELAAPGPVLPGGQSSTIGSLILLIYRFHAKSHLDTLEQAVVMTA